MSDLPTTGERFERFAATIARLRAPDGCPWDVGQTHMSISRNMIEEAYEAVDAIEAGDAVGLCEELGDMLLQVVFHTQMAAEAGEFTLDEVIEGINDKMVRRHPHVFGDDEAFEAARFSPERIAQIKAAQTAGQVLDLWDQIKLSEKEEKAARKAAATAPPEAAATASSEATATAPATATQHEATQSLLDDVPRSLPALMQAQDISRKAVSAGFEWERVDDIWRQVELEVEEFKAEDTGSDQAAEEFGDVLFTLVNVARREGIDAEVALRNACHKFRRRWAIMEQYAYNEGKPIEAFPVKQQEAWWQASKEHE